MESKKDRDKLCKKKYRETHREQIRESERRRAADPERKKRKHENSRKRKNLYPVRDLFLQTRSRSKGSGIPFDISEADIVVPKNCPVLGIPLFWTENKRTDNTPSLDKLVPELGYVPSNISVISDRANSIKSNGTSEEHRKIADWVDEQFIFRPRTPDLKTFLAQPKELQKRAYLLVDAARKRCRKNNAAFALSNEDLLIPATCPILGIPIIFGSGKVHDNSPSLDKIVPEFGYVPENVAVISWRANRLKSFGTAEEHRKIADWMDKILGEKLTEVH